MFDFNKLSQRKSAAEREEVRFLRSADGPPLP